MIKDKVNFYFNLVKKYIIKTIKFLATLGIPFFVKTAKNIKKNKKPKKNL